MSSVSVAPKIRQFSSYNGLDRTVMYMGIPILPGVLLMFLAVIFMFVGMNVIDGVGIFAPVLLVPAIFWIRQNTQTDDKALQVLAVEMKYRFKRVAYKEFGNTLTFVPDSYLRYEKTFEPFFEDKK